MKKWKNMNKKEILSKTADFCKRTLDKEGTGHDWWHTERVWKLAKKIAEKENITDTFIIELGALLHDIADWKFHGGDEKAGSRVSREWLQKLHVDEKNISSICHIIDNVSFKGAGVKSKMKSLEGKIVQDADRLDAIGAIGITRTLAYGGKLGREIHNPNVKPVFHKTFEEYKNKSGETTVSHFYEKLLLLKNLMNTESGRKIARHRHKFIENFLDEFYKEWDGKR
jgi:uncharacterized protein